METQVSRKEIADATHKWTAIRLPSFPRWDFEDIWNEAYLQAAQIVKLWDKTRGNLSTFLNLRLYERVRIQYLKDLGYVPLRRRTNGVYGTRSSCLLALPLRDNMQLEHKNKKSFEIPENITKAEENTIYLMMRGLSKNKIADMEGISTSAICSRLKRMRMRLYD